MPPSNSDRKISINVWLAEHPFPDYLATPTRVAREFEKIHPEYRIELQGCDFQQIPAKVAEAASRGAPPDLAEYYYTASQLARDTRAADGTLLFTSVERAIAGRRDVLGEPVVLDDIVPAARDYYTCDGDLTSVPATITTTLLFANQTLLRAAGITSLPRTWSQLAAACELLAAAPQPPPYGVTWPNHGWLFQQALAEQGGLLANRDNGRSARATAVDLASAAMLTYVRWWRQLYEKGHYLYSGQPWDWTPALDAFLSGQVAYMLFSSVVADTVVQEGQRAGFEVGVGQLPRSGLVPYAGHMVSGQSLWLTGGLDQATQDGALAFMQYLLNPRNAADWHQATGFLPATASSFGLLASEGWFDAKPYLRAATEQLAQSDRSAAALGAVLGNFAGIQCAMTRAMDDVLVDGADPVARFSRATEEAQRLLDQYNADCAASGGPRSLVVA